MAIRRFLLVEGPDDKHTVEQLCNKFGLPHFDPLELPHFNRNEKDTQGVDDLLASVPTRLKLAQPGDIFGIVVDADSDLDARWQSVRNRLIEAGYQPPDSPDPNGTIVIPPDDLILPPVGVWIMPENKTKGKLEDFLRFLVPNPSLLYEHVESCVASIPPQEKFFTENDAIKAKIHTWLAWQSEPGRRFGTAITAGFFNHNAPEVRIFIEWIRRLYKFQ